MLKKVFLVLALALFTALPAVSFAAQNDYDSYCSCNNYCDGNYYNSRR